MRRPFYTALCLLLLRTLPAQADVGDPQIRTDHPWYPGELACSTFERVFAAEAEQYQRATGSKPVSDQDKAMAARFWRNIHFCHRVERAVVIGCVGSSEGHLRTRVGRY